MAGAARAASVRSRQQRQHDDLRPDFQVINGKSRRDRRDQAAPPAFLSMARTIIAVVGVLAVLAVGRLWLTSHTAAILKTNDIYMVCLSSARAEGAQLEIERSALADTDRIRKIARNKLGMSSPSEITYLSITGGVLATDGNGNLSLSGSIAALDAAPLTSDGELSLSQSIAVAETDYPDEKDSEQGVAAGEDIRESDSSSSESSSPSDEAQADEGTDAAAADVDAAATQAADASNDETTDEAAEGADSEDAAGAEAQDRSGSSETPDPADTAGDTADDR